MNINNDGRDVPRDKAAEGTELVPYVEEPIAQRAKRRIASVILCALTAVIFLVCVLFLARSAIAGGEQSIDDPQISATDTGSDEWRGVFKSREISDGCMAVCVSVRLGAVGEYGAQGVSGFVVSPDGWIVSSDRMLRSSQRGRLYVRFYDGSEYAVENVVRFDDSGLSFMKIDADGIEAASLGSAGMLSLGEEIVAISSTGAPEHDFTLWSGIVAGTEQTAWFESDGSRISGLVRTDILFEDTAMGSPIFDKAGDVLGIALYENERFILPIDRIREKIDMLQ